jgi:Amt family ammonium transporter
MYLDLDEFKLVNDTGGHVAGDALLRALTQQWQRRVRGNDVLARLGGDEFAVLVEAGPWEKALELAEDLRRITKDFRFQWLGKVHEVGASIGVVSISQYRGSLAEALSDADAACYRAKGLGRNRIHVSAPFVTSAILAAESAEP